MTYPNRPPYTAAEPRTPSALYTGLAVACFLAAALALATAFGLCAGIEREVGLDGDNLFGGLLFGVIFAVAGLFFWRRRYRSAS